MPPKEVPCQTLSSNNSDKETVQTNGETTEETPKVNILTGGHKRSAFVLATEIMGLAEEFGLERLGFLTLTFSDRVQELKEANRRFNVLLRSACVAAKTVRRRDFVGSMWPGAGPRRVNRSPMPRWLVENSKAANSSGLWAQRRRVAGGPSGNRTG